MCLSQGGALQYEMDIHVGVRLRLPNPGAFGERREKKWGHRVRAGQNEPKLSKFSKIFRPFGENSSRFEGKIGFRCEKFQKLGVIWRQNVNFSEKMGALGDSTQFCEKIWGLWVRL